MMNESLGNESEIHLFDQIIDELEELCGSLYRISNREYPPITEPQFPPYAVWVEDSYYVALKLYESMISYTIHNEIFEDLVIDAQCTLEDLKTLFVVLHELEFELDETNNFYFKEQCENVFNKYYGQLRRHRVRLLIMGLKSDRQRESNLLSNSKNHTDKQRPPLDSDNDFRVWHVIKNFRRPHSRNDIRDHVKMNNKNLLNVVDKFIELGIVEQDDSGKIRPKNDFFGLSCEEIIVKWPKIFSSRTKE